MLGRAVRKRIFVFVSLLLIVVFSQACDDRDTSTSPSAPSNPGDQLIVAVIADAGRLDPHTVTDAASMRVIENMYATLLRYGERYGDFENDLAESVDVSADGRTWTITLVDGATFHSGNAVTAEAVAYSFERIMDKDVRAQQFESIETMNVVDERTLVVEVDEPVAAFRSYLAYPMNAIVDPAVVEANEGSLDSADAGSGPFQLVDWQRDRHVILEKHEGYHVEGLPKVDRLVIRPIADQTARTTALRTGEVHLVEEVAVKDAAILEKAEGVVVESVPGTFWEYIGLNCRKPPFDHVRMRQLVAETVDRQQLNTLVKFGRATPLPGGHIPPNHWAHADLALYPSEDGATVTDANVPAGLIVDASVAYQVRAAEVIKQQLRSVGIDVAIQALESTVFYDRLGKGDFQMTVVGWMGFVDPDEWTWNLFHTKGKYNQQGYSNARVDELLDEGRRMSDREKRKAIYREAQQIIASDAPMVFLYVNDQTSAWRKNVKGYKVHPTATTLGLRDTWIER